VRLSLGAQHELSVGLPKRFYAQSSVRGACFGRAVLVLSPVLLLLLCLAEEAPAAAGPRLIARLALKSCITWAVVNGFGLLLLTIVLAATRNHDSQAMGWALRLWPSIVLSGLPSAGLAIMIASSIASRRAALLVGLLASAVLGYLGILAGIAGVHWVPGALDQDLFASMGGGWWWAAVSAGVWLLAWVAAAAGLAQLRHRQTSGRSAC